MAEGRNHEVGLAPAGVVGPCGGTDALMLPCSGPSLAAWYRHRYDQVEIAAVAFGGRPSLVGVVGTLAWRVVDKDRLVVAPKVGLGFLSAGLSVPVAAAVSDRVWWWIEPGASVRTERPLRLGTGISYTSGKGIVIGAEVGGGYGTVPLLDFGLLVGFQR